MLFSFPTCQFRRQRYKFCPPVPLFFFFSSRRRHTRSLCDWSSDVCSSDLRTAEIIAKVLKGTPPGEIPVEQPTRFVFGILTRLRRRRLSPKKQYERTNRPGAAPVDMPAALSERSEERRVGKECRGRATAAP